MKIILEKINQYNTIIIHRHLNPDLDAIGSQRGLAEALKINFPDKKIYVVGDMNNFNFLGQMDIISNEVYHDALAIILDVGVSRMVSDDRYLLAKERIIIDHHTNTSDIEGYKFIDSSYSACAEMITEMLKKWKFKVDEKVTTALYGGITTDTGRFLYCASKRLFKLCAYLVENKANPQFIYDKLYVETLDSKRQKSYFANSFLLTRKNVAYLKNDQTIYEKFSLKPHTISRAMVGQMSGIEEVRIWANFTYNPDDGKILCEFRSRNIPIVHIAKKYGGGGHEVACGATVDSFEVADEILNEFDKLLEEVDQK